MSEAGVACTPVVHSFCLDSSGMGPCENLRICTYIEVLICVFTKTMYGNCVSVLTPTELHRPDVDIYFRAVTELTEWV